MSTLFYVYFLLAGGSMCRYVYDRLSTGTALLKETHDVPQTLLCERVAVWRREHLGLSPTVPSDHNQEQRQTQQGNTNFRKVQIQWLIQVGDEMPGHFDQIQKHCVSSNHPKAPHLDWRNGSTYTCSFCSWKGPKFRLQNTHLAL